MISKLKKWIYTWSTPASVIVAVILVFNIIATLNGNFLELIISVYLLVVIIRVRLLKRRNTKIHLDKMRNQWNNTFGDNSFDSYFDEKIIRSKFFTRFYNSEYNRRYMEEQMKRGTYNNNNNKKEEKTNSENSQKNQNNQKHSDNRNNNQNNNNKTESELDKALKFFNYRNLSEVKQDELKVRYRKMVKRLHPDNGGDIKDVQKLNLYYNKIKACL